MYLGRSYYVSRGDADLKCAQIPVGWLEAVWASPSTLILRDKGGPAGKLDRFRCSLTSLIMHQEGFVRLHSRALGTHNCPHVLLFTARTISGYQPERVWAGPTGWVAQRLNAIIQCLDDGNDTADPSPTPSTGTIVRGTLSGEVCGESFGGPDTAAMFMISTETMQRYK